MGRTGGGASGRKEMKGSGRGGSADAGEDQGGLQGADGAAEDAADDDEGELVLLEHAAQHALELP